MAAERITHMSRLKADTPVENVTFLYEQIGALGGKRGPVLVQLPLFLKKELPRLTEHSRCCRPIIARRSSSAMTRGSTTTSKPR